ncbi:MAG TPA: glycosyltransferase family 2 protein [Armatimonadota bacterium]|nr:glycosyltransferase family 2 protein [Armatimonadota bacterium]
MPNLRVSVIIPALNEAEAVGRVISEIPPALVSEVIVVDNGSVDDTAGAARKAGARVIFEPERGYGAACLAGIAALGPCDIIVFLDADHSDYPAEMPDLLVPIVSGEADLVIGSRLLGQSEPGALPPHAVFGNRLASFLLRVGYGQETTDLGPFRAIRRGSLERLGMRDRRYGWTVEMQARAATVGLRVREVPISYRRRIGRSKITGSITASLQAGFTILWTLARLYLAARRARRGG